MTKKHQLKRLEIGDWRSPAPISKRPEGTRISNLRLLTLSPAHLVTLVLVVLFFGPLIAPLFQATYLPLVADSGALARDLLSHYICPTPAKSYMLLGFPMAVCARCWGATIGLWAAWLVLRRGDEAMRRQGDEAKAVASSHPRILASQLNGYLALAWPLRLLISALPFLLWVGEINLWVTSPYWALLLNGAQAGFWAGLFFYSIWPGLLPRRHALPTTR